MGKREYFGTFVIPASISVYLNNLAITYNWYLKL